MENTNLDVRIALEEMRRDLQQSLDAGDTLDKKLNQILVAAGSILALVSVLKITLDPNQSNLHWLIFIIVVGLYAISIISVLVASGPQSYLLPISTDWEELEEHIFGKPEREVILTLLAGYVDSIQHNDKVNDRKVIAYNISLVAMLLTVGLLVSLLFLR